MSEILNLEAIEQQRILITVSLTGSDGAPVNPSDYVICAAAIGQPNPYTQRAVRKEWAASINNENSAFLLTCPGLDMAGAPWKYRILLKNRALELEWQIVSGRISLTPRTCGTDGIAPASYTVACEATPSGLVNVTLDATVGSISETLEQVKASAAAAASAAQNAHADLEDAETAATKASQAALAAAADARIASDKATAAEAAATAAPEACAPYVQQVQQAAAAALEASRTATTAAAEAQASADAAAPAQGYATRAESAQTAAVQAAGEATTAATTATQQAEAATAQAESARLAATTASTAADNAQSAATRAEDAATRAEAAVPAATRAEAARDAAEAAAATATTAAADVPGLVTRAETAATAADSAEQAAYRAQRNAETAASTATAQAEAAAASATQADTDARAVAILVPRAEAAQQAAADSASAAAASETAAAASATAAAASAQELMDEELGRMVDLAAACYAIMQANPGVKYEYTSEQISSTDSRARIALRTDTSYSVRAQIIVANGTLRADWGFGDVVRVFYAPKANGYTGGWGSNGFAHNKPVYIHAPACKYLGGAMLDNPCMHMIFSPATVFDYLEGGHEFLPTREGSTVVWNESKITMPRLKNSDRLFAKCKLKSLPDGITFANLENAERLVGGSSLEKMPAATNFSKLKTANGLFWGCSQMEIDEIVRVCNTLQDLQALPTPTTAPLGLPIKCKHGGVTVDCEGHLNSNYPDFLVTLAAKGWTVSFANINY